MARFSYVWSERFFHQGSHMIQLIIMTIVGTMALGMIYCNHTSNHGSYALAHRGRTCSECGHTTYMDTNTCPVCYSPL